MKKVSLIDFEKNKNYANLLIKVLSKEKFLELKTKKNQLLIIWKYIIADHSKLMEFFSLQNFRVKIDEKRIFNRTFDIFYRGKKRLIGNLGARMENSKSGEKKIGKLFNNLSKINYKKGNFQKKYKVVNK
jgi:hypothetical protein